MFGKIAKLEKEIFDAENRLQDLLNMNIKRIDKLRQHLESQSMKIVELEKSVNALLRKNAKYKIGDIVSYTLLTVVGDGLKETHAIRDIFYSYPRNEIMYKMYNGSEVPESQIIKKCKCTGSKNENSKRKRTKSKVR